MRKFFIFFHLHVFHELFTSRVENFSSLFSSSEVSIWPGQKGPIFLSLAHFFASVRKQIAKATVFHFTHNTNGEEDEEEEDEDILNFVLYLS